MAEHPTPHELGTRPTVTVIIPCYNYGHLLRGAVASALDNRLVDVSVVIVDDASPDGSAAVARQIAAHDGRVTVIEHEVNRGHIATYNDGLDTVITKYLSLLSADDLLTPGALDRACALFESDPEITMVYGRAERFSGDVPTEVPTEVTGWTVWEGGEWAAAVYGNGTNVAFSPEVVVRTTAHQMIGGGYDPAQPHAGDLHMWLRLAAQGRIGHIAGATQALYRIHGQNMHIADFGIEAAAGMLTDFRERQTAFTLAAAHFEQGAELVQRSNRVLARDAVNLAARAYVWGLTELWPVKGLVDLALELDPQVVHSREWQVYMTRKFVGSRFSHRNPVFVAREYRLRWLRGRRERRLRTTGL